MGTAKAIIDDTRIQLNDVNEEEPLWSQTELISYLNDCRNEAIEDLLLIRDNATSAVCSISVSSGTATYSIDSRVIRILRPRLTTAARVIEPISYEELDEAYPSGWESETGDVTNYVWDMNSGKIVLFRKPIANDTLTLLVYRKAMNQITATNVATESLELPSSLESALSDGIMSKAYMKQDAETLNEVKAQIHQKRWDDSLEKFRVNRSKNSGITRINAPMQGAL